MLKPDSALQRYINYDVVSVLFSVVLVTFELARNLYSVQWDR
jgi:hypothetical protein